MNCKLAKFLMNICGWRYRGDYPSVKKAVIISVPHTSIWDFIWGELAFQSQKIPSYIIMKREFFFWPLGPILKSMNVIPLDRGNKSNDMVGQMVAEFNKRDEMYLCITPEGSRKKRKKWKKGFLMIAIEAKVPIYLGRIDYKDKYCEVGELFYPSGNIDEDMKHVMETYRNCHPKYPENFSCGD